MTVDELEGLIKKAEATLGCAVAVGRNYQQVWWLVQYVGNNRLDDATLPEIVAKLREWATPPKPATLTIEVPFTWAEFRAGREHKTCGDEQSVTDACREALKPWAQS